MKELYSHSAKLLKIISIFTGVIVAMGVIFCAIFGFNQGVDFGGYYQIKVDCFNEDEIDEYIDEIDSVLADYGYSIRDVEIEDRSYCSTIVVRYKSESATNAEKIRETLVENLELNDKVTTVDQLSAAYSWKYVLYLLIGFGVMLVALFLFGHFRRGYKYGLSLAASFAFTIVVTLSIFAFTRIEFSLAALFMTIVLATFGTVLFAAISVLAENKIKNSETALSKTDAMADIFNMVSKKVIIPLGLIALLFVGLMFTFNKTLVLLGLASLVAMVVTLVSVSLLSPALYLQLENGVSKKSPATKVSDAKKENKQKETKKEKANDIQKQD